MSKGLRIAEPPPRRPVEVAGITTAEVREGDKMQFNKRVSRGVADGFEMLAIRTRRKVPELLAEALDLLQERYGRV